jgi:hypothetical protein
VLAERAGRVDDVADRALLVGQEPEQFVTHALAAGAGYESLVRENLVGRAVEIAVSQLAGNSDPLKSSITLSTTSRGNLAGVA